VFPAPARCVLGAADYAEALARSRADSGRGLSRQSWLLVPKITEVDRWVRRHDGDAVLEVHPELAFCVMDGGPCEPKRTAAGRRQRLEALRVHVPGFDAAVAAFVAAGGSVAVIGDLIDAAAVAWSTRRLAAGGGVRLGGELDGAGVPMAISY
jgi:predicted RNase H-like nuclease